jgi:hypothetical protein
LVSHKTPMGEPWIDDPLAGSSNTDIRGAMEREMVYVTGMLVQTLNVKNEDQLEDMLRKSPDVAKKINSLKSGPNTRKELEGLFSDALSNLYAQKPDPEDIFIDLGKGWYWKNLRTGNCDKESQMMGHCGIDDRGTLYSLRDPQNKPHVTLTYNDSRNSVFQIKGKQNVIPAEKYWPAVKAFFDKTGAKLFDRSIMRTDLGRLLGQEEPQRQAHNLNVIAQVGNSNWVEDPNTPDGYVLLPADEMEDFANLDPDDDAGHAGYDYAWIHDGELDFSVEDEVTLDPLLQVLRQNNPDLKIRREPPGMGESAIAEEAPPLVRTSNVYHVSNVKKFSKALKRGQSVTLKPAIPRVSGGEDDVTPRVSFAERPGWAINVLPNGGENGETYYVFKPTSDSDLIVSPRADDEAAETDPGYDRTFRSAVGGRYGYEHDKASEQDELWSLKPIRCSVVDIIRMEDWEPVSLLTGQVIEMKTNMLALEHARMMGPVAYAEALAQSSLTEDSRGNIVRLLGVNRKWAEFFNTKLGKFAFPFAKWVTTLSMHLTGANLFKLEPGQAPVGLPPNFGEEARERLEPYLQKMSIEDAALTTFLLSEGMLGMGLHPWEPVKRALQLFQASPKLVSALSVTQKLDVSTLQDLVSGAGETIDRNQSVSDLGEPALSLAGGFEWRTVTDEEFNGFAGPLGNCGEGTGDQMYVLIDGRGKAHAAASYHPKFGLDQVVGYGNEAPKQKYRPMVMALAQHLGTKLARGEKSWGASFGDDPGAPHEGLQLEFLTDIASSRREAMAVISDIVSDHWDLLVARGVNPEGMKYLGAGNNGMAWQLADARVLKVTTDDAEAHVASHLKNKKFKHVFTIYDCWAFPGTYNGEHVYGLITEAGLVKPSKQEQDEFDQMCKQIEMSYGEEDEHGNKEAAYDLWRGDLRQALQGFMAADIHPRIKRQVLEMVKKYDLPGIAADMKKIGFQADLHSGNIMKRPDGTFVVIDIGTGGNDEDDRPPFMEGHLDQPDGLNEVGILGAPQAGSTSRTGGVGTSAWSGGKMVLADPKDHVPIDDEDEETQYLDQNLKGLGPAGSNSPY